jgi:Cys-tRNA(Pro)/Cys-tRNA(Cys) deacylase
VITNNILRLLESRKIRFKSFELPSDKLSAVETASFLNVSSNLIYKSIIIAREKKGKVILCMVPGSLTCDLKKIAHLMGEKNLSIPSVHDAEQLTGLKVGGISPLVLYNKDFEIILDQAALLFQDIYISGGQRGLILLINTKDLISFIKPKIADITVHPA